MRMMAVAAVAAVAALAASAAAAAEYVAIRGSPAFTSVIANDASGGVTRVDDFAMRTLPVTRGEFQAFVRKHSEWSRQQVAPLFADAGYLADGTGSVALSQEEARRPVTHV